MTVEEMTKEVRKDPAFFFHSKGGVTLSDGEPLSQPSFTLALLQATWSECISTATETTFFAPWATVHLVLPYVDTASVDIRALNRQQHKLYCGADNQIILEDLLQTNMMEKPFRPVIRVPIISEINDSEEELEQIGQSCSKLHYLHHVQLLPYYRLGTETYKKLGRQYLLTGTSSPSTEQMLRYQRVLRKHVEQVL